MTITISDFPASEKFAPSDYDKQGQTEYVGRLNKNGSWYIARNILNTGETRYAAGISDYSTSWTNRTTLTYVLYDDLFSP